jgi:adenosylcobyric acid synthase
MAKALMVQGCSSNAGKSYLVAGLCRLYASRGLKVAPFKAQNMSNNAGVTPEGLEMGRAQLLQAQAARVTPQVRMNPVLVKPEGETRSQVVVLGKADLVLSKLSWTARKAQLWESVRASLASLMREFDLVVIEGAGSPAEVNLKAGDIANMRVAKEARARVLLVADIDRGGAFAHLLGTWHCLESDERSLLMGFILNKFRGDATLLESGIRWLEQQTGVPTLGVVPYLKFPLPEEDAFSLAPPPAGGGATVAILRFPTLANFDEFDPLAREGAALVRWAERPEDLRDAGAVILPGSKHVAHDLAWLRETGCAAEITRLAEKGVPILGICGGLQMLGRTLRDPHGVESGGEAVGLGLLDIETELAREKTTRLTETQLLESGEKVTGYEIHHGRTRAGPRAKPYLAGGLGYQQGNVVGVYVHGLFENAGFRRAFLKGLGLTATESNWHDEVEAALERLAAHLSAHLDITAIDRALGWR